MKKVSNNLRVTEIATIANNLIRQYQWDPNINSDAFLKKTVDEIDEVMTTTSSGGLMSPL